MTVVARVRAGRGFAIRLVGCVLLSAAVVGTVEGTVVAHLADRAVVGEELSRADADAAMVQRLSSAAVDPWSGASVALDSLTARPDVRAARILDTQGHLRLPGPGPQAGTAIQDLLRGALESGRPTAGTDPQLDQLDVVVPVRIAGEQHGLQLVLDAAPAAERATTLRRALLGVIGVGVLASTPLMLALGGRRLIRRHRSVLASAELDDLTGIGNRRAWRRALASEVDRAQDTGTQLSVLAVEVQGLGEVSRTLGRRRGEAMLAAVAQSLISRRPADTVFRTGGDAFAVLLPGFDEEQARELAGRLGDQVATDAPPLSVLIGSCALDERCPDLQTLQIGMDAALAEARAPARPDTAFRASAGVPAGAGQVWDIREITGGPADPW